MNNILSIHQITSEIITVIDETKSTCYLVTPYYKPWTILMRSLEKAANSEKKIVFVFRKDEIRSDDLRPLADWGFDVVEVERLHTKLYMNEKTAIITSMNLHESSMNHNFELGYKVTNLGEVKKIREDILEKDILRLEPRILVEGRYFRARESTPVVSPRGHSKRNGAMGFCIRCGNPHPFNPGAPYCYDCYQVWAQWANPGYLENCCHGCGTRGNSSMDEPLCSNCAF